MGKIPNWYVISGGPSSGKTTLISELAAKGYKTVDEAARFLIEQKLKESKSVEDIQNTDGFQKEVLELQLQNEKNAPRNETIFFDRAVPDGLAYCRFQKLNVPEYADLNLQNRYKKIFFCEQLPVYKDNIRVESDEAAHELSRLIYKTYRDLGYEIIDLPAAPTPDDRIKIVLSGISKGRSSAYSPRCDLGKP